MKKVFFFITALILALAGLTYLSVLRTEKKFRTCEIIEVSVLDNTDFSAYDSLLVAANILYRGDWIKRFVQGEQYRDAWETPVKVPIIFLDTLLGGLSIVKEGGGMQTHSLKVADTSGIQYSFRSVTKDPSKLVPDIANTLGLENIVIDGVSAQHPYAALVVAKLADAADVKHTHPKLYFLPKQRILEKYNDKYGNRLYLFEYETKGEVNWTGYKNVSKLLSTEELQKYKQEGKHIEIDTVELVRTRLFDLIIGDWDRHAKQWGWAVEEFNQTLIAHPIAGDRDNAFFKKDGVLPNLISNAVLLPEIQSLKRTIGHMPGLVRPFDEYFLKTVPLEVFIDQAHYLQKHLTDSKIEAAFKIWPKDILALDGDDIKEKIISRRNEIEAYAKEFRQILEERDSREITLKGSEDLQLSDNLKKCFNC